MNSLTDGTGAPLTDGDGNPLSDGTLPSAVYDARTALFFVAEVESWSPYAAAAATLRVSDLGFRTRATDSGGVVTYPPLLDTAFEIDRRASLDPAQASTRTNGAIRIINMGRIFDGFVVPRNTDSRPVRVLVGQKTYDPTRGVFVDPPYSDLRPFFAGTSGSWLLAEDVLEVPLKDTSYWIQRPLQSTVYGGTGKLDGTATLAGKLKPITRGGTAAFPVLNVPLVQVDPVAQIWQWTDAPGQMVKLYEAGAPVILFQGDVTDLYAGSTLPGYYRTNRTRGLVQLGSKPTGQITADVTGAFPIAGAVTTAIALAYAVLTEQLGLPTIYADQGAFLSADAYYPYVVGFFVDTQGAQGDSIVSQLLVSAGATLISTRSGQLRPFVPLPSLFGAAAEKSLGVAEIISVTPSALPAALDPPPFRWRVNYAHNHTVQTSALNGTVSAERQQFLANADSTATGLAQGVVAAWLRPGDPAPIATLLLAASDAADLAGRIATQWQSRPGYQTIIVPLDVAAGIDIGDVVDITWPLGPLAGGARGQVTGEQIRSYDATVSFEVLITSDAGDFSPADFNDGFAGGAP